uniref:hypothetical protein n=1 Tax=Aminobacter niigataensis TaxID=83265 RepID=UPI0028525F37|nr:hypothetical protein [Aminobacter niigataensis]WMD00159.1 hypothetical protein RAR13_28185 [Aminobacter niigataensis]
MAAAATYAWPGLEGVWVAIAVVIALWWIIVQHRMETLVVGGIIGLAGTNDGLISLLTKDAVDKP